MFNLFKKGVRFVRTNPSLLFSLILIIVIPVLIFFLSAFLTRSFQENIDFALQKKAMAIQSVLSLYVSDYYTRPELLQRRMDFLVEQSPGLFALEIFLPVENNDFETIVVSGLLEGAEREVSSALLALAWHEDQSIALPTREGGIRFWRVIRPFRNQAGEKTGLISMALSLEEIDSLVMSTLEKAYLFTIIAIIFILLLVIHHARLFQYVNLFNKLRESDKSKDSFMNMTIHELRSPVVNIKNYILELRRKTSPFLDTESQLDLKIIEISVKRLDKLINDVLDVVRIEQGRLSFAPEIVSPVKHIQEVMEELNIKAVEKGLKITLTGREQKGKIGVNIGRFKEIIYNLIDNAIKYTQKGEINIVLKGDVRRGKFYITIADTGIGLSAEEQKLLFERFYRVKNRETADIQGTGLGLWISKQLCLRMKGKILLESIQGVGSKFILIFPIVK